MTFSRQLTLSHNACAVSSLLASYWCTVYRCVLGLYSNNTLFLPVRGVNEDIMCLWVHTSANVNFTSNRRYIPKRVKSHCKHTKGCKCYHYVHCVYLCYVTAALEPQRCSSAHTRWGQTQCLPKKTHTANSPNLPAASLRWSSWISAEGRWSVVYSIALCSHPLSHNPGSLTPPPQTCTSTPETHSPTLAPTLKPSLLCHYHPHLALIPTLTPPPAHYLNSCCLL